MEPWDAAADARHAALVATVCDATRSAAERDAAWKRLLVSFAPHVEAWAKKSRVLRRAGLATEDDARAVLVATFARLQKNDFDNLRSWLARRAAHEEGDERAETDAIERLVRLAKEDDADEAARDAAGDDAEGTPLRGWLANVVRFVIKDHVKHRLGWAAPAAGAPASKRDLETNADRIDDAVDAWERPPVTDLVALRRLLEEIRGYVETFPAPMRAALDMWMQDASYGEIAARLGLESEDAGRALARAAQARLRERFRHSWPEIRLGEA
jgi:hypothetical protein